jgi:hypothetical protein
MSQAKRGDFVCIELEHVAVFQDNSIGRVVTHSTLCGVVWNATRDGLAKTVRTRDGYIRNIEKMTGYLRHHVCAKGVIDVEKAIDAAQGKETAAEVREAVRPLLFVPDARPVRS